MAKIWIAALALLAMAGGVQAQMTASPYQPADKALQEHLQKPYSGDVDADFMGRMMAQHEAGIERAKVALAQSKDAKVRLMAGDLLKSLNTELQEMKDWMSQHGMKPQAAAPAPMPLALPAATPPALSNADKMRAAATLPTPVPVSASKVVTASLPPVDAISDTMALNELSPAAGPEKLPGMPIPEQDIENAPPVMEFLDDVL